MNKVKAMSNRSKPDTHKGYRTRRHRKLPPKGSAARAALAGGLWSHLTSEEIERMKREIFGSRKSAA